MVSRRGYDDPCGIARALALVGERWALLVVRELLLGPKRFTDLSRGLPSMSHNVLSQRLRELEESGIVRKRRLGPPASATGYELTGLGKSLDPVLTALATFGSRLPLPATKATLSADAFMLALRTSFDATAAGDLDATYGLRLDDDIFHASIRHRHLDVARGAVADPDATITSDVKTLRAIVFGGRPLGDAVKAGDLTLEGDRTAAERFAVLFPRPQPVPRS